jgi:hypothetical protein
MDQNSQRFALWGAARNIFLVLKKENVFLENKKRTFNKVRVFQKFYSQLLDNNLKFHILYIYMY